MSYNVLVINGPNLSLLGKREPEIYGKETLSDIITKLRQETKYIAKVKIFMDEVKIFDFQSDIEGEIVKKIGESFETVDGIIINPGAYTHTSIAIYDALKAINKPTIEVHLSNINLRENFRHTSITSMACIGQIAGLGGYGYILALYGLLDYEKRKNNK